MPYNYVPYILQFSIQWGALAPISVQYPFSISGTNLVTPYALRYIYNVPDNLAAISTSSKVGIGALVVRMGPGFFSYDDAENFILQNNLPDTTINYEDSSFPR
jgi:hypothetical protein